MAAHSEKFASRGQKYQKCLILSSRGEFLIYFLSVYTIEIIIVEQT